MATSPTQRSLKYLREAEVLTHEHLTTLLSYDQHTGLFTRIKSFSNNAKVGVVVGSKCGNGYMLVGIGTKKYYLHRLAWLYVTGVFPEFQIDHINGDRADNRFANLRHVTNQVNSQNQRNPRSNKENAMLGASRRKDTGRWAAYIQVDGKKKNLGCFDTAEQAHSAYVAEKRLHHVGCTI